MDSLESNQQPADPEQAITDKVPAAADQPSPPAPVDEPQSLREWLGRNSVPLLITIAVTIFALVKLGVGVIWVVLGLGFVIFVHELGHFLVAKWCDVHVETFSIGFGPALPGCRFQRGETTYMLAMVPLGGYVKMVGENPDVDEEEDENPRSFKNKSVWQRMAIISAGVIMNVIFGCIVFGFVFLNGMPRRPAVVGTVSSGSAAWQKGIKSGDVIYKIGGAKDLYFMKMTIKVTLADRGEALPIEYGLPGSKPVQTTILPIMNDGDRSPKIGVGPAQSLKLYRPEYAERAYPPLPVDLNSAAQMADPPFEPGDEIIASTGGIENPSEITDLPANTTSVVEKELPYFEFYRRLVRLAGKEMKVKVRRIDDSVVTITIPPAFHRRLGLRMRMGHVAAIRLNSPAAKAMPVDLPDAQPGIQPHVLDEEGKVKVQGDVIKAVEVQNDDGSRIRWVRSRSKKDPEEGVKVRDLDPVRLPFELQQWADQKKDKKTVTVTVSRIINHAAKPIQFELEWEDGWKYDHVAPIGPSAPKSITALGLAYFVQTTVDHVYDNYGAKSVELTRSSDGKTFVGLQKDDVIKEMRTFMLEDLNDLGSKLEPIKWRELDPHQWANTFAIIQGTDHKQVEVKVERDGEQGKEELTGIIHLKEDTTWPKVGRGIRLEGVERIQVADNFLHAIGMGFEETVSFVHLIVLSLKKLGTDPGRASKGLAGPIQIASTAYTLADMDTIQFLFFLAMISVNLAVINFLPIPVLDGGHMVFLIYEWIRGKPASESVRIGATYVGLAFILGLMVFVFYLDIVRLWF